MADLWSGVSVSLVSNVCLSSVLSVHNWLLIIKQMPPPTFLLNNSGEQSAVGDNDRVRGGLFRPCLGLMNLLLWFLNVRSWGVPDTISLVPWAAFRMHWSYSPLCNASPGVRKQLGLIDSAMLLRLDGLISLILHFSRPLYVERESRVCDFVYLLDFFQTHICTMTNTTDSTS